MEISRYTDSKWHKRQLEDISQDTEYGFKQLYFNDILPCIIYTLEKTSFEIVRDKEGAMYLLKTIKLDDLKTIKQYKISKKALKNIIGLHIEGYLNDEGQQALKSNNKLAYSMISNFKDMLIPALMTGQLEDAYAVSKEDNLFVNLTKNKSELKLKFKEKET